MHEFLYITVLSHYFTLEVYLMSSKSNTLKSIEKVLETLLPTQTSSRDMLFWVMGQMYCQRNLHVV